MKGQASASHVDELQVDPEVLTLESLDNVLQVVDLLATDPHLVLHDLGLDLELALLGRFGYLLTCLLVDPLEDIDTLAHSAVRSWLLLAEIKTARRDFTARQFATQNVDDRRQLVIVGGEDDDTVVLQVYFIMSAFEIEALVDLFARLVDGIVHFLQVHLENNIKTRHIISPFNS